MKKDSKDLVEVKEKIKGMKAMTDYTKVTTDEELNEVADKIKVVKNISKIVKAQKDKYTEPAKAIIAEAKGMYDPMLAECKNAEFDLKSKANKYMSAKEEKRIEAERKLAARVERGTMKVETAMNKIEALPQVQQTVRTNTGAGLRQAKRKVAKIENPDLIPKEYWVIDEKRVCREALAREKENLEQIPGMKITEVSYLSAV